MIYSELNIPGRKKPYILMNLFSILRRDSMMKKSRRIYNLNRLFLNNGFFNVYHLIDSSNTWHGIGIYRTKKSNVPYILLMNNHGEEKRISAMKLLRRIKDDTFGFEKLEFKPKELKF